MKRVLTIGGIAVTAVVLLTGFRGGGCGGHGGSAEERSSRAYQFLTWKTDDALKELDATDAQKKEVNAIKDRLFEDGKELFVRNREVKTELFAQWEAAQPDATKVHQLVDERFDALRAFAHKVADGALELHRILTPEQRKEVTDHAKERMERH